MVSKTGEGGRFGCIGLQSFNQPSEGHTSTHHQTGGCHLVQGKEGGDGGGVYTVVEGAIDL